MIGWNFYFRISVFLYLVSDFYPVKSMTFELDMIMKIEEIRINVRFVQRMNYEAWPLGFDGKFWVVTCMMA